MNDQLNVSGERLDAALEANQTDEQFVLTGLLHCQRLKLKLEIIYKDTKSESRITRFDDHSDENDPSENGLAVIEQGHDCHKLSKEIVCTSDLRSHQKLSMEERPKNIIYVPFDVNEFDNFTDEMTDDSYNMYKDTYYPAFLSMKKNKVRVAQISNMSFKYPSSPLLYQWENVDKESICSIEKSSKHCSNTPLFCECIQIIEVPLREYTEIILIDEGFGGNLSHTFHVHGYNVSIIGYQSFSRPILKEAIVSLDHEGKLPRNYLDPPQKDTFVVPNKGYVILQFYSDNEGYWLWEARASMVSPESTGFGLQFLMKVGTRESFSSVPIDFPTCRNNKAPPSIFEAEYL